MVVLTVRGIPYEMAMILSFIGAFVCTVELVLFYKQISSKLRIALSKEKSNSQ